MINDILGSLIKEKEEVWSLHPLADEWGKGCLS